ncbi:Fic family protein [Gaiella sp.]|uniref:Fic family protein n=1 Tax=Gaiella sp. TaxID=2663207 RepID=UPI00398371DB
MRSFLDLDRSFAAQPPRLGAVLARIDFGRGQESLYRDQLPALLSALAEQTRVASVTASNAIEGVVVASERAEQIVQEGTPSRFRNRNEREFAGYSDAIDEIMRGDQLEALSVPFILHIHRQLLRYTGGRGGNLKTDDNLIVRYEDGQRIVIFKPPPWQETEYLLRELVDRYNDASTAGVAHPIVLMATFILDFLAIHPFAHGNGRVARILTSYLLLHEGYGVSRYVSVEQRVFESKNSYYASLQESQQDWRQGEHRIWPWVEYITTILDGAYDTFEQRIAAEHGTSGLSKQERVRVHVLKHAPAEFKIADVRRALPGVSSATIRLVLNELRDAGKIRSSTGRSASWTRID